MDSEVLSLLERVAVATDHVIRPVLRKKTGIRVVSAGADHGQLVTELDLGISAALLNGFEVNSKRYDGFRHDYKGSFSEEDDSESEDRIGARTILELDPMDGTGDFADTYQSKKVMGPTTLVAKLERDENCCGDFEPKAGIIMDIVSGEALASDGKDVGLYVVRNGKVEEVKIERQNHNVVSSTKLRINRRASYPQLTFDGPFINYLRNHGMKVEQVSVGGAGIQAMQFFRNYISPINPCQAPYFAGLAPIDILFNAQPDWKTWDTDPTDVIANVFGLPERTDIYGDILIANAALPTLKEMHHTTGYVLAPTIDLRDNLTNLACEFRRRNPDCPLTEKNYDYKKAIIESSK